MCKGVGFSCRKVVYLKLEYVADDEFKEIKRFLKENNISNRDCTNAILKMKKK